MAKSRSELRNIIMVILYQIDIYETRGVPFNIDEVINIIRNSYDDPKEKLMVEYQLGNAMFCKCDNITITKEFINNLKKKMQEIIDKDLKIDSELIGYYSLNKRDRDLIIKMIEQMNSSYESKKSEE